MIRKSGAADKRTDKRASLTVIYRGGITALPASGRAEVPMRSAFVRALAELSIAVVAILVASTSGAARQTPSGASGTPQSASDWKVPRTPWGDPELQGVWSFATYTPLERPAELAGKEFFTPDEAKAWLSTQSRERGVTAQSRELYERCIAGYWGRGLLSLTGGGGLDPEQQLQQTPTHILLLSQSNNDMRIIPLDGRPHVSSRMTPWFGDSRGRWEGDTLVIETTNFDPEVRYRGLPMKNARVVERLTRIGPDALQYRITAEDPTIWTRPWTAETVWPRRPGPIFEFACHEGSYGIVNVLKGERQLERNGTRAGRRPRGGGGD